MLLFAYEQTIQNIEAQTQDDKDYQEVWKEEREKSQAAAAAYESWNKEVLKAIAAESRNKSQIDMTPAQLRQYTQDTYDKEKPWLDVGRNRQTQGDFGAGSNDCPDCRRHNLESMIWTNPSTPLLSAVSTINQVLTTPSTPVQSGCHDTAALLDHCPHHGHIYSPGPSAVPVEELGNWELDSGDVY